MMLGFRAWCWIAAFGGALACNPDTSGLGGGDTASVDPTNTGTTGGSGTDTTGTPPGSSSGAAETTAASSGEPPPGTEGSTTASVDTADTEDPPMELMRCNDQVFAIPDADATGVVSPIDLTIEGTIVELRVSVQATHTWVGDLAFELSRSAEVLTVIDRPMGCNGNDIDVVLHDEALATIDGSCHDDGRGTPALSGELLPETPIAPVFGGQPVVGTWRMRAIDGNMQDEGTLTGWCLQITYR